MAWGALPASCWAGSFSVQHLPLLHQQCSVPLLPQGAVASTLPTAGQSWDPSTSVGLRGTLFGIVKTFSMIFRWSALGTFVLPVLKDETESHGYKGSICFWKVLASKPHAQIPVWQASCMEAQGVSPTGLG